MATEPLNPAIGDTYVTDDGEPRKFFAPGRWDTDWEALAGDGRSFFISSNVGPAFTTTTAAGQTYYDFLQADSTHFLVWLNSEGSVDQAAIVAASGGAANLIFLQEVGENDINGIAARTLKQSVTYVVRSLGPNTDSLLFFEVGNPATTPSLITAWDNTKTDYQQGEWVATGGELFVSNANQTAVNDPSGDTGEHWTQYPAPRAYEYSILADQFSSYQGTWADLINYYIPARGWTVTRLEADENEPPAAFDFNNDGNPITLAVGESVDYDGAQWVKAGAVTTTTVTLTGTTDADGQTNIPYAGDVSKGYLVEIEVSADRWLPQNYGDRTDEAANYFQVLYDKGLARFEMWAVGTALQGKPYRIAVY